MHASAPLGRPTRGIDPDRIAYTVSETARLLGISERMVRKLIRTKELSSFTVGVARRVQGSAIEEYIRSHTDPDPQERAS